MAAKPNKLTIAPYLQRWDASTQKLHVNIMVVPTGDPLKPLSEGWPGVDTAPAFAEVKSLLLTANLSNRNELPILTEVDATEKIKLTMPEDRTKIFDKLKKQFVITKKEKVPKREASLTMKKYLTRSYRQSFSFVQPKTALAVTDSSYQCRLRCPPPKKPIVEPKPDVSWGEAMAFVSRQPVIGRALGLIHSVEITVTPGNLLAGGGWLFFLIAADSEYASQSASPGFVRTYATRIPALDPTAGNHLFTPVLFPVSANPAEAAALGNYDEVFLETSLFSDGFAKIVHCCQPLGADPLDEEGKDLPPHRDEGVQLAWDDEDVLISQNRQVGFNPDGSEPPEAPMGVAGYRVDVRSDAADRWHTLTKVYAEKLEFGKKLDPFEGELRVEVHPSILNDELWLPAYYTRWKGGSMVIPDVLGRKLSGIKEPKPSIYQPLEADEIPLRYGRHYQLRVRMVDPTGGGPALADVPWIDGDSPVTDLHFKRYVRPLRVSIADSGVAPADSSVSRYRIGRPGIAFPQAVYTGTPDARNQLEAILNARLAAPGDTREIMIPDPDADYLKIRVLIRMPTFDPMGGKDGWMELYTTYREFPSDLEESLELELVHHDVAQLKDLDISSQTGSPGTISGAVPLPTARDVTLELSAVGRNDMTYFGNQDACAGPTSTLEFHVQAKSEPKLFKPIASQEGIRSIFLKPDSIAGEALIQGRAIENKNSPVLVSRLAQALDLQESEGVLIGYPGQRIVFGCAGLKHYLPPDNSSLKLTAFEELTNQWINGLHIELDRDWSWKGFGQISFKIKRRIKLLYVGPVQEATVGEVQMHHVVTPYSASGKAPERDKIYFIFLDAFVAPLYNKLPYQIEVNYHVTAALANGESQVWEINNTLPVTTVPTQLPKVAAAGHALSEYQATEKYSASAPRLRMLWLEFAEPLHDKRDNYFVRVLAHAPDPMLLPFTEPVPDPPAYEKPALDPELIRIITPDQPDDLAGLSAMQPLVAADDSDRHFLVPLPPNTLPSSPELFGFYTYEIRVGHDRGAETSPFWSTAQGRFGPAIIVEGVQHPSSPIECGVSRNKKKVVVSANYAQPYYKGQKVMPDPPQTQIWIVLYAQVRQADGKSFRNIQLDVRFAKPTPKKCLDTFSTSSYEPVSNPDTVNPKETVGFTQWSQEELDDLLKVCHLPMNSNLSILAVEVLPEPNGNIADPLGGDLGEIRILRTSPLIAVANLCCKN
jgi:hypothetical protein